MSPSPRRPLTDYSRRASRQIADKRERCDGLER
jgi:hypothetical protein